MAMFPLCFIIFAFRDFDLTFQGLFVCDVEECSGSCEGEHGEIEERIEDCGERGGKISFRGGRGGQIVTYLFNFFAGDDSRSEIDDLAEARRGSLAS